MFSCTYNGWSDAPEEEREALDAYDAAVTRMDGGRTQEPAATARDAVTSPLVSPTLRHAA